MELDIPRSAVVLGNGGSTPALSDVVVAFCRSSSYTAKHSIENNNNNNTTEDYNNANMPSAFGLRESEVMFVM